MKMIEPVTYRKTTLSYLSFDVSALSKQDEKVIFHQDDIERDFTDRLLHEVAETLLESLSASHLIKTFPDEASDKRYISTYGDTFVKCYHKTNNGILFFLPEG